MSPTHRNTHVTCFIAGNGGASAPAPYVPVFLPGRQEMDPAIRFPPRRRRDRELEDRIKIQ